MIKLFSILFMLFTASQCVHLQHEKNTQWTLFHPTDKNIQYVGNIDYSDSLHLVLLEPGVQIRTGFKGTSLDMMATLHSGYFMVEIDGGEPFKVSFLANTVVRLASDLPDSTHQAVVTFIEGCEGHNTEFHGFFVDKGKTLAPATPAPKH